MQVIRNWGLAALGCAALLGLNVSSATAATTAPVIRTTPALDPAFSPTIPNYVTRCDTGTGATGTVSVYARANGNLVSVDGSASKPGIHDYSVTMTPGQRFTIQVGTGASASTYNVRCLPTNFPTYSSQELGPRQVSFVLVTPDQAVSGDDASVAYIAMLDSNGVPVWWYDSPDGVPGDADLDPNGDLSWATENGPEHFFGYPGTTSLEVHNLDGQLLDTLNTVGTATDFHEGWPLANGDFLIDSYVPELNVPIDIPGFPSTVNVLDGTFQEIAPDGTEVYSWGPAGHINPADSVPYFYFRDSWPGISEPLWDWDHINAVQPYEDGYLVSFRDTESVYYIDGATGNVIWKLGGTYDPGESLTIVGDPDGTQELGSQHDVRVWPDGSITVMDNGTKYFRAPRAVRFSIDYTGGSGSVGTATMMSAFTYPAAKFSICCGSVRAINPSDMATTDWLIAWGETPYVTEATPTGQTVFELQFGSGDFSYRAVPITSSELTLSQLENAMDTMYGTPAALSGVPYSSPRSRR